MGKRELLLILGFVMVGAVVYQATAPPPDPNTRSLSISRFLDHVRREIRGNRASTELTTDSTIPVDREVTELRVTGYINEIEIVGEDRRDVEVSLRVNSNAFDEGEAKKYAERTALITDHAGTSLVLRIEYPREGRQRASLSMKVPARLRARIESRAAKLSIAGIAGVEATNSGGDATIKDVPGRVAITHRGGSIAIADVASLKFTGRNADVKLKGVRGDASIIMEQGGEMTASELAGPLDVESRNADVTLENLEPTRGPIRVNATNGTITMNGIKAETRVDGRNAELQIAMSGAVPIVIYSEGEDISLTPPPGGFRLDAVIIDGKIEPDSLLKDLGLEVSRDAGTNEARASGPARGGGPTITVRTTRGDFALREADKPEK
jgi:hypothetical protein